MAITYEQVCGIIGFSVNKLSVEDIEASIDRHLSSYKFLTNWQRGTKEDGYFYNLSFESTLTDAEKKILIDKYLQAGFAKVEVHNSEENNGFPGMVTVTITFPPSY